MTTLLLAAVACAVAPTAAQTPNFDPAAATTTTTTTSINPDCAENKNVCCTAKYEECWNTANGAKW